MTDTHIRAETVNSFKTAVHTLEPVLNYAAAASDPYPSRDIDSLDQEIKSNEGEPDMSATTIEIEPLPSCVAKMIQEKNRRPETDTSGAKIWYQ